ncbi:MAG: inosine/xanthosine triphosphatase [Promethearchaeota archaeon]
MINVIVGSKNPVKIAAVKAVFTKNFPEEAIEVQNHPIGSQVPNQPIGIDQIFSGALNRAEGVKKWADQRDPKAVENVFFVGIEAGLIKFPPVSSGYLAYSVCVILDLEGNRGTGTGPGWEYPTKILQPMLADRSLELADVMGNISGDKEIRNKEGAVGFYSQNRVTRYDLAYAGIQMALIPFLQPGEYFPNK